MAAGTNFAVVAVLANESDAEGDPLTVTFSPGSPGLSELRGGLLKFQSTAWLSKNLVLNDQMKSLSGGSGGISRKEP